MANQSFIYDSDAPIPNVNNPFTVERTALIRAAGLTESVPLYMAVGVCLDCANDLKWAPVIHCGSQAELSDTNTIFVISIAGRYSFGDPTLGPLTLAGDVNITKEEGVQSQQMSGLTCTGGAEVTCEPIQGGLMPSW